MSGWYASRFTGLFTGINRVPPRPHDPDVIVWAGTVPASGSRPQEVATGGAGWDARSAEAACVGEALERFHAHQLPDDVLVEAAAGDWPLDEPLVPPERWVLFHRQQYAQPGFPFEPLTAAMRCRWVCCRQLGTGEAWWAPAEMVYLFGSGHRLCPSLSTGLACGRFGEPVLLRALQEVIERDALMGAWWGRYPLHEVEPGAVFAMLGEEKARRVHRPNLLHRFHRIATPFSRHTVLVTVEGEDREGWCFSAGSACRETRSQAWEKALLEAIHGRYYVRHLLGQQKSEAWPRDFAAHAVFYSRHPEQLGETVLKRPASQDSESPEEVEQVESLDSLCERLGRDRPVLFRLLSPPGIVAEVSGWVVVRVLVPGLQPMHGDHLFPFLGGPLWGRGIDEWTRMPPHPFP